MACLSIDLVYRVMQVSWRHVIVALRYLRRQAPYWCGVVVALLLTTLRLANGCLQLVILPGIFITLTLAGIALYRLCLFLCAATSVLLRLTLAGVSHGYLFLYHRYQHKYNPPQLSTTTALLPTSPSPSPCPSPDFAAEKEPKVRESPADAALREQRRRQQQYEEAQRRQAAAAEEARQRAIRARKENERLESLRENFVWELRQVEADHQRNLARLAEENAEFERKEAEKAEEERREAALRREHAVSALIDTAEVDTDTRTPVPIVNPGGYSWIVAFV